MLSLIGVYGITSYAVSRRTREIGLRIALGAQPQVVVWRLVGRAMLGVVFGAGMGALLAVATAGLLSSIVFDVAPKDAKTLAGVPVALALIAFVASYLPARRAARVDALVTLRQY